LFLAWDLKIHRLEGIIMVSLLALYVWRSFSYKEDIPSELEDEVYLLTDKSLAFQFLLIIGGLIALVGGAKLLISGGVSIARNIGISEWFIGITIVAIGTSLPEIVSSVIAARRGHGEMAIGNIFGSNIFNILMVLGITSLIHPLNISEPIHPDLIIATGITGLLLALIVFEKHSLGKISGVTLLATYFLYIALKGMGTL
jgi:cation:H+ antiporter